jgi:hypothetical protein
MDVVVKAPNLFVPSVLYDAEATIPSTSPPIKAFQPAELNAKSSDESSKLPLMMPHVSFEVTEEVTELEVGVTELEAEDWLEELGCDEGSEGTSPHATRNNAVNVEIVSSCFLFMISPFLMNNDGICHDDLLLKRYHVFISMFLDKPLYASNENGILIFIETFR